MTTTHALERSDTFSGVYQHSPNQSRSEVCLDDWSRSSVSSISSRILAIDIKIEIDVKLCALDLACRLSSGVAFYN